jgi:hypothetical protein
MALRDGIAQSISNVGTNVIFINNGTALSKDISKQNILFDISSINDSYILCPESMNVNAPPTINKIVFKTSELIINSAQSNTFLFGNDTFIPITMKVNQYIPLATNTMYIFDKNDTRNYFVPYLTMDSSRIKTGTMVINNGKQRIEINNGTAISYNITEQLNSKKLIDYNTDDIMNIKTPIDYKIDFNMDDDMVINNGIPYIKTDTLDIPPITMIINDLIPPTGKASNDGGLKSFRIVIQKQSYFEQFLSFSNNDIISVDGLPQGIRYENGYIRGSATLSGKYNIIINFSDNTVLTGLLIVTPLQRVL